MQRVLVARERVTSGDAPFMLGGGIVFLGWAWFVFRTGWTSTDIARRVLRREHAPGRAGLLFWVNCIGFAVSGCALVVSGIALML